MVVGRVPQNSVNFYPNVSIIVIAAALETEPE
jgi:hypothetical protein